MPPRKATRKAKAKAVEPEPETAAEAAPPAVPDEQQQEGQEQLAAPPKSKAKGKGKGKATAQVEPAEPEAQEAVEEAGPEEVDAGPAASTAEEAAGEAADDPSDDKTADATAPAAAPSLTPAERMQKLKELRTRMNQSTAANRKDLIADHQKTKTTAKEIARLEKQKRLAENLREKIEAEETGEDLARQKNWEWTIEDSDKWDEKLRLREEKTNFEHDDVDSYAQRKYTKDLIKVKPDLHAYNLQKEAALGLAPGTLVPTTLKQGLVSASSRSALASTSQALSAAESLYRDGNTLVYADNKPSEDAIDRVVGKMNADVANSQKLHKRRREEEGGDVTYINDQNKHFNKKINRYFDKYTAEIRANFERGTAL